MQEKKPRSANTGQDESSKADDQSNAEQHGEVNQAVRDKQSLADKQAIDDKQLDLPVVPRKFAVPMGEWWPAVDKSSDESGTPKDAILKQAVLSLDDTADHLDQLAPGTDAQTPVNWGPGISMQAVLDPSAADTRPADDGTKVDRRSAESAGGAPGTVIVDWMPGTIPEALNPAMFIDPRIPVHGGRPLMDPLLMDPLYVLEPVAITLSGGGAFGAFEVGALDFIYNRFMGSEEGVAAGFSRPRPDIVTGTSIGAVNGAWIAQGDGSLEELKDLWFGLRKDDDMFRLNKVFHDLVGDPGDTFGPAIGRILGDIGWNFVAGLLGFGFLFHKVEGDIDNLYTALNAESSVYNLGPIRDVLQQREPYWSPIGPGLRGAGVSVACDLLGHRIVFARGYDDMLYVRWQLDVNPVSASTQWSQWESLGGPISSDPVAHITGFNLTGDNPIRVGVIARLANEQRYGGRTLDFSDVTHFDLTDLTPYDPFGAWADVPPPLTADPPYSCQPTIIQRTPDGRAWAFCCDKNRPAGASPVVTHRSFFSRWDGRSWETWTQFGQNRDIAGNVTGCSYFDGTEVLELFTRGAKSYILHSSTAGAFAPGTWEEWDEEGKAIKATSDILVVLAEDPEYIVDVFWRGTDGQVWTRRKAGSRGSWGIVRNLEKMITSNLCSGRNSSGICTIFARGLDDHLYELRQTSVNGDWPVNGWNQVRSGAPPGLTLLADPYTLAATPTSVVATGEIEVYVVASDHSVWTIRQQQDGTYTDWVSLGGKVWTGIQLRMSTVALETGKDRFVDEAGRFVGAPLEPIVSGDDGDISFSRTAGIIASSSLPGLFPPVRLNGQTWVDGGVRRGVPIGAAIDAGAKRVIAISTVPTMVSPIGRILPRSLGGSDAGGLIEDYSHAGIVDIAMRSLLTMVDAMHWAEIAPETSWPRPVSVIQPTFKIEGGDAIDPGLIRINYAYGWMRAFDVLMTSPDERPLAIASTDRVINTRCAALRAEATFREQYLIATDYVPTTHDADTPYDEQSDERQLRVAREAAHLAQISLGLARLAKGELKDALIARRNLGFLRDPDSPTWLSRFEKFTPRPQWGRGWERLLQVSDSPFDEITITVTIDGNVGGSVGAALPPTL